jgi:hypothetical protein
VGSEGIDLAQGLEGVGGRLDLVALIAVRASLVMSKVGWTQVGLLVRILPTATRVPASKANSLLLKVRAKVAQPVRLTARNRQRMRVLSRFIVVSV